MSYDAAIILTRHFRVLRMVKHGAATISAACRRLAELLEVCG
jgi:hypothetical protein